jgi:hypothetical protein
MKSTSPIFSNPVNPVKIALNVPACFSSVANIQSQTQIVLFSRLDFNCRFMSNNPMNSHRKLRWLFALLIVACFIVSCGEMNRANRLIEDSNNAVKESEQYIAEAEARLKQLDSGQEDFPANREQLETTSREAIELLEKAAVKLREAAANYQTASQAKIDDKLREYLSIKSQEFNKHVEHLEAAKDIPKAIIDTAINDAAALNARRAEITNRIEKLKTEWVDLAARAKKIQEENKEKFEQ